MSDFKAKMHQNRFRLGLRPRPRWGSPRPLAGFKGPTSKGREKGGRGGKGRKGKGGGKRRGGREWRVKTRCPMSNKLSPPMATRRHADNRSNWT